MRKPCPVCKKRTLKKVSTQWIWNSPFFKVIEIHCFSCGHHWLPLSSEKRIDKRIKDGSKPVRE